MTICGHFLRLSESYVCYGLINRRAILDGGCFVTLRHGSTPGKAANVPRANCLGNRNKGDEKESVDSVFFAQLSPSRQNRQEKG